MEQGNFLEKYSIPQIFLTGSFGNCILNKSDSHRMAFCFQQYQ